MRHAYLVLAAALVLAACGSGPTVAASHRSPSPSVTALIARTALDMATCHEFEAEQAGRISADQFSTWLLRKGGQTTIGPESSSGMDNVLSTTLGEWYAVHATGPSGDLQPATYYAAEVRADCLSIRA